MQRSRIFIDLTTRQVQEAMGNHKSCVCLAYLRKETLEASGLYNGNISDSIDKQ